MKERGIIFNSEMVRAILDNRKTQTRRIIRKITMETVADKTEKVPCIKDWDGGPSRLDMAPDDWDICPYGVAGDRLWVRETFALHDNFTPPIVYYRADDANQYESDGSWTPSIFMPRWASRITLGITKVRVERVQEITTSGAREEGFPYDGPQPEGAKIRWFRDLWESIHGAGAWERNDWVWVLECKKVC